PLTNLVQALRLNPGITKNIKSLYLMGGAVNVPGNVADFYPDDANKVAEWNIFGDVEAANEVFESGITIYLVPLDATNQVLATKWDISQWRKGGEIADFAADIYDSLLSSWNAEEGAIWDVMTAVIMLNPELCDFQPYHLQVITKEGNTNGQTAIVSGEEANSSVCLEPDADGIRQTLIDVFSSSPSIPPASGTSEPTPARTPVGQIFRDDFTGSLQSGWTWLDENPPHWTILSDGWLQIIGEDDSLISDATQSNLLCRTAPEGDFQITVHLTANPTADFQQAALFLYQDGNNYVSMNRGYCGLCGIGGGMFMDNKFSGSLGSFKVKTQEKDVYLRLVSQDQTVVGYYSFDNEDWQRFGRVGNYLEYSDICLGVSNVDSAGKENSNITGKFDYIEISQP
ncbi:MAG: nucleoside hydrolase, partial [Anaerolineaceae bacterium]